MAKKTAKVTVGKSTYYAMRSVSLRVPGAPILLTTSPYTRYKFGEELSVGRRIAMEVRRAAETGRLAEVVT